jgi:mono/diheme cytochrome c family protein
MRARSLTFRLASFALLLVAGSVSAQPISLERLSQIHAIAVSPERPGTLYVATHEGLFSASEDGNAERISQSRDDLMSLVLDPSAATVLYASGHPGTGGNLGLVQSQDGGRSWRQLSPGAGQPMDFRELVVSPADPKVLYGHFKTLNTSRDAGRSWIKLPRLPAKVYALAASARDPDVVYAATRGGLLSSTDGGRRWQTMSDSPNPASMVHVTRDGIVHAFVVGVGLIEAREPPEAWTTLHNQFGEQVLIQFAVDRKDPRRLYALNQFGRLLASRDAGASWHAFAGDRGPKSPAEHRGEKLYQSNCRQCHGLRGVGETHSDMTLNNPRYVRAPALDDSTHAWHHSDDALVKTILEGSPREPRMRSFKDVLREQDARDIVAYMKSLWGRRALACQGSLHMDRECLARN